jgi:NADH-quinone oxidoreductase subunit A
LLDFALVLLLVAGMLAVSFVFGHRHQDRATGSPYQAGIVWEGSARVGLSAKFYLVAMLFAILKRYSSARRCADEQGQPT